MDYIIGIILLIVSVYGLLFANSMVGLIIGILLTCLCIVMDVIFYKDIRNLYSVFRGIVFLILGLAAYAIGFIVCGGFMSSGSTDLEIFGKGMCAAFLGYMIACGWITKKWLP